VALVAGATSRWALNVLKIITNFNREIEIINENGLRAINERIVSNEIEDDTLSAPTTAQVKAKHAASLLVAFPLAKKMIR
jgi:hypothetical protein